jgi:hypothetical protein
MGRFVGQYDKPAGGIIPGVMTTGTPPTAPIAARPVDGPPR